MDTFAAKSLRFCLRVFAGNALTLDVWVCLYPSEWVTVIPPEAPAPREHTRMLHLAARN